MSGAKALLEEIKRSHYSNVTTQQQVEKSKPQENTQNIQSEQEKTNMKQNQDLDTPKKRRKRRTSQTTTNDMQAPMSMFTVTVVGGMKLPGYKLAEGEKLVIAKLTPIAVGT